jgi:hypothetical protein
MTPEGGTSIQASARLAAGLLRYLRVVRRGYRKRCQSHRLVPGTCRKMLKGLRLKLLGRPAIGHSSATGQRVYEKGKKIGAIDTEMAICRAGRLEGWVRILR